jgi:hypothetical protein
MNQREKIGAAVAYLKTRKIPAGTAAPPLYRLFWAMGLHVPPPHFQSFLGVAFLLGTFFGLLMGVVFAFMTAADDLLLAAAGTGLVSGVLFGLTMAGYFRWSAAKLGLPAWRDFDPEFAAETAKPADADW